MHSYLKGLPALVPAATLTACGSAAGAAGPGGSRPAGITPAVEVVRARLGSLPLTERISGTVRAQNQVVLYSEISAPVERVAVRLKPIGERSVDGMALADDLRRQLASAVPGAEIRVEAQSGLWMLRRLFSSGTGNEAVEIQLRGYDIDVADRTAREIQGRVERIAGVTGVRLSRREGRPEQNSSSTVRRSPASACRCRRSVAPSRRRSEAVGLGSTGRAATNTRSSCGCVPRTGSPFRTWTKSPCARRPARRSRFRPSCSRCADVLRPPSSAATASA